MHKKLPWESTARDPDPRRGRLSYRRRRPGDGGRTTKVQVAVRSEVVIDNKWVVFYNHLLFKAFNTHINVEFSVKSIDTFASMSKSMSTKGVTWRFLLSRRMFERTMRSRATRWAATYSNEAVWRMLGFSIHERNPTVVHHGVHLENGQRVHFT